MVAKKRGGFFGALLNGIKSIAGPLLGNVGKVVSSLFGGAKTAAKQVAHQAVNVSLITASHHRAYQKIFLAGS